MKILARYILKEYLVPLVYCLCGFLSIYILFELFGSFSWLIEAKLPLATTVEYFCAYLAPYFEWLAPAAVMLAAMYTMWNLCRHSELIAMRANGVSFLAIASPIFAVAILIGAFVFWVNDCYVPERANWARKMKTEKFDLAKVERSDDISYRNARDNRTWTAERALDSEGHHLVGVRVAVDRPGGGARLLNITAEKADYLDGEWWFTGIKVQHFENGGEVVSPTPELDSLPIRSFAEFRERPRELMIQNRPWKYNSIRDCRRFLRTHPDLTERMRRKYTYDIWSKIMSPFACLVIVLFAIPAGVVSGRQSVFRGVLTTLGAFFLFYAANIAGMVAADGGWCPPIVAAVTPYVVFFAFGVRTFHRHR